jgi:2-polyprenyl-6-methoxyphenol hydroxylase-like FAD-dependent oxidoreductase
MAEVVIVGAGPAGTTLALLLVKRGISVKLIESSRSFRRVFRGEGLLPSGLDALEQMGLMPLLARIPHRSLDAWEFWLNDQLLFRADEPFEPGGRPTTLVSQPTFLEAVIAQASTYSHFEFLQGIAVQDLLWCDHRVSGIQLSDGRSLAADLVVGTDGRNSVVRQRANLLLKRQVQSFDILWFKLASHPRFEAENIFYSILSGNHAFGLFQSAEGMLQIGWFLKEALAQDWKTKDWSEMLAAAAPAWLAEHCRAHEAILEQPLLLSVVVGHCPRWSAPGALLLGDAAHPMSPIRAQGINMALRDVIVAANYLVPAFGQGHTVLDGVLPQIQAEREPEILRLQFLQQQEATQAERLGHSPFLRWAVTKSAPLLRPPLRQSWLLRQRPLRQGVTSVILQI